MSFYAHFSLTMDRSPGFGSYPTDYTPYSDSLSLRLWTLGPSPCQSDILAGPFYKKYPITR